MSAKVESMARRQAAQQFARKWAGRGYEKGDTASFWLELLRDVVGMPDVTTNVRFETSTTDRGYIDVVVPDAKTMIEQKSLGIPLDKAEVRQGVQVTPFEQAKRYADSLPNSQRPDRIIVSDFATFRIHDLDTERPAENYVELALAELADHLHLLDFLRDPKGARVVREERASLQAGELIGRLYELLRVQYLDPDSSESQHSLNVLSVRLVFCLFAEDAGLFPKNALHRYLNDLPARQVRAALRELFAYLNTPPAERDPYASPELRAFPYVNGGLFSGDAEIPPFSEEIVRMLVDEVSEETDWSNISPTIFGAVFESTLNPNTRRSGGMHYTSPQNIHRVIDPLFLDDLTAELDFILSDEGVTARTRRTRLQRFHDKIAGLQFFDPACGSGNFLTETYLALRRLENKVLSEQVGIQTEMVFQDDIKNPLKVGLSQFHGIEVNDFALSVATTALWIAELQANAESQTIVAQVIEDLPLADSANIVLGNALNIDWKTVIPASGCDYVIGNPPFYNSSGLSTQQRADRSQVLGKNAGSLDYVACWFKLAAEYMRGTKVRSALVATNSICQGRQVVFLWEEIVRAGIKINFAHRTFRWASESRDAASVHVVIVGFSYVHVQPPSLFTHHRNGLVTTDHPAHINAYLVDGPDEFVHQRRTPLPGVPVMRAGGKPVDGGNLLLSVAEKDDLVNREPAAEKWIRRYSMGEEFISGEEKYCLWLKDCPPFALRDMPLVRERVERVREMRLASTKAATRRKADTPWLFDEIKYSGNNPYLAVPSVSSERRSYVPIDFVTDGMIPGNMLMFIEDATPYEFGIVMSRAHNSWMRAVAGRLKSDYRYTNTIVYYNFVWPECTAAQREAIATAGRAVLDSRGSYPGATLEDLYDPDDAWLYPALVRAHEVLDAAVERAYGWEPGLEEKDIVGHLFTLYSAAHSA